jgi:hypothetical protein
MRRPSLLLLVRCLVCRRSIRFLYHLWILRRWNTESIPRCLRQSHVRRQEDGSTYWNVLHSGIACLLERAAHSWSAHRERSWTLPLCADVWRVCDSRRCSRTYSSETCEKQTRGQLIPCGGRWTEPQSDEKVSSVHLMLSGDTPRSYGVGLVQYVDYCISKFLFDH